MVSVNSVELFWQFGLISMSVGEFGVSLVMGMSELCHWWSWWWNLSPSGFATLSVVANMQVGFSN